MGTYAISNFECVNTFADGTCETPDGGNTLIVTGGDTGAFEAGSTWLQMFAPASLAISFDYAFTTEDVLDDPQLPMFDVGGYVSGGQFKPLSLAALAGTVLFQVNKGQLFGFGVETVDNFGGPGILSISNFDARELQTSPVPEPGSATAMLIAFSAAGGLLVRSRRRQERQQ
jgi:hypothetical protein